MTAKKTKRQSSPLEIGTGCAILAVLLPIVSPVLFLASIGLLIAAFVLAILPIVQGKITGGILLLIGSTFAFPMSCAMMTDRTQIVEGARR